MTYTINDYLDDVQGYPESEWAEFPGDDIGPVESKIESSLSDIPSDWLDLCQHPELD